MPSVAADWLATLDVDIVFHFYSLFARVPRVFCVELLVARGGPGVIFRWKYYIRRLRAN